MAHETEKNTKIRGGGFTGATAGAAMARPACCMSVSRSCPQEREVDERSGQARELPKSNCH